MPFYFYTCKDCGHEFEAMHNINLDATEVECVRCKAQGQCERRVSVPGRAKVPGGTGASKRSW